MNGYAMTAFAPQIEKFNFFQSRIFKPGFQVAMEAAMVPLRAQMEAALPRPPIDNMAAIMESPAMIMAWMFSQPEPMAGRA